MKRTNKEKVRDNKSYQKKKTEKVRDMMKQYGVNSRA